MSVSVIGTAGAASRASEPEGQGYAGISLGGKARAADVRTTAVPGPAGIDVASYQGEPDWAKVRQSGVAFAYVKATEGTSYRNPYFGQQYGGSRAAGLIRGAYHFARPDNAGGAQQADFFVDNGGRWTKDGWTLPGALDVESLNGKPACYGKTPAQMVGWISAFSNRYKQRTGRLPAIYSNPTWWKNCTGDSKAFASNPWWHAEWDDAPDRVPGAWTEHTVWQYTSNGTVPGISGRVDLNAFNGTYAELRGFAARFRTSIQSADAMPEPVGKGARVTMKGRLLREGAVPIASAKVALQFSSNGRTWTTAGSGTTTATGWVTVRAVARRDGRWRLSYAGNPYRYPSTSPADYVDARRRTALRFDIRPEPVRKGRKVTASGRLTVHTGSSWAPFKGVRVRIYFRAAGAKGAGSLRATVTTDRNGRFTRKFKPARDGYWWAVFVGGPDSMRVVSGRDFLDVR